MQIQGEKNRLEQRLYWIFAVLCLTLLLGWGGFYLRSTRELLTINKNYTEQVSDRIIDTLENIFLNMEYVAVALSASEEVKSFVTERDLIRYHEKAGAVSDQLASVYRADGLVSDILIYDNQNYYRRFLGNLGNTAATRIGVLIDPAPMPQHIALTVGGTSYIGYVNGIYNEDAMIGFIVFLMQGDTLQELFNGYDSSGSMKIALAANGSVVAANRGEYIGETLTGMRDESETFTVRGIGQTPFRVVVSGGADSLTQTRLRFAGTASLTVLALLCMVIMFYRLLHRYFLHPMLSIIGDADRIGGDAGTDRLKLTGEPEFDRLVEQINGMIARLEENSRALLELQNRMQNTEIERQRVTIVSLKQQIDAHFTVNTLNVIKRLSSTGQHEKVGELCDGFSHLLRYANGVEEYISGMEEMRVLARYVEIMEIRYPDRFEVDFEMDDEMDEIQLPRMLLQPILENAIFHGLQPLQTPGRLYVLARVMPDAVVIRTEDNGVGMSNMALAELRRRLADAPYHPWGEEGLEHIALPNIQKRVVSLFGEGYGLTIESQQGMGTAVTLTLPVIEIPRR